MESRWSDIFLSVRGTRIGFLVIVAISATVAGLRVITTYGLFSRSRYGSHMPS